MRVIRTAKGARLVEGNAVLSEVLSRPGPTHSVFDLLAACVVTLAPGPRIAMLGFGAGGIVAPLRAMGFRDRLQAVDIRQEGEELFRRLSGTWAGRVHVANMDASRWLRGRRGRYDLIIDDLSVRTRFGVTKPEASIETLPGLIHSRLAAGGVAVTNLLTVPGLPWSDLWPRLRAGARASLVVSVRGFENRVHIAGPSLGDVRNLAALLRGALRGIGSRLGGWISVRTLSHGGRQLVGKNRGRRGPNR